MKEFELTAIEPSDFKDPFGNIWCNAVFLGVGEPVKVVTPDPDKWIVGEKYYGEIETKTSKAGKPYLKFKRAKPEDTPQTPAKQAQDDARGDAISASMCVKLAFQAFISSESMLPQEEAHWRQIDYMAEMLKKSIDKIKENKDKQAIQKTFGGGEPFPDVPDDIG